MRRKVLFIRSGPHSFCDRTCSGLNRRQHKSDNEKRAAKSAYDRIYRKKNRREIKRKKREHFQRTYDPIKAAIERKKNMARHVEYCRRPEYRKKKHGYDIGYNARRRYGPFAEVAIVLRKVEAEVEKRMSKYDIRIQQGTLNKAQTRKKALYEKIH